LSQAGRPDLEAGGKRLGHCLSTSKGRRRPAWNDVRRLRLSRIDRMDWIYLAVIASALLLLLGAGGLVMFNDLDLMHLARTFRGTDTK
jgi:hypothetical protein